MCHKPGGDGTVVLKSTLSFLFSNPFYKEAFFPAEPKYSSKVELPKAYLAIVILLIADYLSMLIRIIIKNPSAHCFFLT